MCLRGRVRCICDRKSQRHDCDSDAMSHCCFACVLLNTTRIEARAPVYRCVTIESSVSACAGLLCLLFAHYRRRMLETRLLTLLFLFFHTSFFFVCGKEVSYLHTRSFLQGRGKNGVPHREDLGSPANLKLELSRAPACFVCSACSWKKLHRSICVLPRHCPVQMNARTDTHTLVPTCTCVCVCLFVFLDVWHLR